MSSIFSGDNIQSPETPRSPYKASNGSIPQATNKLLHFDGTPYTVNIKPSRRPSQTTLTPSQSSLEFTREANVGIRTMIQYPDSYRFSNSGNTSASASPRKVGISPGGPTSIVLG
jgi:hypothetical protein